jgi:hypothetical protein
MWGAELQTALIDPGRVKMQRFPLSTQITEIPNFSGSAPTVRCKSPGRLDKASQAFLVWTLKLTAWIDLHRVANEPPLLPWKRALAQPSIRSNSHRTRTTCWREVDTRDRLV